MSMLQRVLLPLIPLSFLSAVAAVEAPARRPLLVTVDDLPISSGRLHGDPAERERITRGLLGVLEKHGIRAVGMVTWNNVRDEQDRKLLELWLAAGHELGNHSKGHLSYTQTPEAEYIADIEAARQEIAGLLEAHGQKLRFFRFPFLREGHTPERLAAMRDYLEKSGQRNLPVTIDNQDWSFEEPWVAAGKAGDAAARERVGEDYQTSLRLAFRYFERIGDELFGRPVPQILLLHANEVGTGQWDALFSGLERDGYRFATADEVLADPAFAEKHEYLGTHGPSLWERIADSRRRAKARESVRKLLDEQIAAWNRGDLDAFCSVYAEDASFLSPSGWTQGRQGVLDRYRKSYPDKAAMGTLSLEVLEMRLASGMEDSPLDNAQPGRVHGVTVAARWKLSYPGKDAASGLTLIVLLRGGGGWQIVQDASM